MPMPAIASGTQVLSLFWLSVVVFTIVIGALLFIKISLKHKIIIFLVYFISVIISHLATSGMPYMQNMYLINTINTAVPFFMWLTAFIYILKIKKHNKKINKDNLLNGQNPPVE